MSLRLVGVFRNLGSLFMLLLLMGRGHLAIGPGVGLTLPGWDRHPLYLGWHLILEFKGRGDSLNGYTR